MAINCLTERGNRTTALRSDSRRSRQRTGMAVLGGGFNGSTQHLTPDYFRNPIVSVEVLEYRNFFILGEVANPGPYPYVGKMTVITAVAMAGGFTYRAVVDEFIISRDGQQIRAGKETCVFPGDVVEVRERFF